MIQLRLVHTIFFWLFCAIVASLLTNAGIASWHLGDGFSEYLNGRDTKRLEKFATLVEEEIQRLGSVEKLRENSHAMPRLLHKFAEREGLNVHRPKPPPQSSLHGLPGEGPPPGDADAFGHRVSIYDLTGSPIAGPPIDENLAGVKKLPIRLQANDVATLRLRPILYSNHEIENRFLRSQYVWMAISSALLTLVAMIFAWLASRRWVAPLGEIHRAIETIARGQHQPKLIVSRSDEIGDVMRNVNALATTLTEMQQSRRRWIADVSHELRTPLSNLKCELEALGDGIIPLTKNSIKSLADEIDRMSGLVNDLHLLSVADRAELRCNLAPTDLNELVPKIVNIYKEKSSRNGLSIEMQSLCPSNGVVSVDGHRVEQLLVNLLENSFKYTKAPGRVSVSVRSNDNDIELVVEDTEPGVSSKEIEKVFEPLFRGETARLNRASGSGLGLAICTAIAKAHGARIFAEPSQLGGLKVGVAFSKRLKLAS
jgi:two-component system, OmpR family, sensor histidine kinase BaeS